MKDQYVFKAPRLFVITCGVTCPKTSSVWTSWTTLTYLLAYGADLLLKDNVIADLLSHQPSDICVKESIPIFDAFQQDASPLPNRHVTDYMHRHNYIGNPE